MQLYILAKCQRRNNSSYIFNFKGVFLGRRVNLVSISYSGDLELGKFYFITANMVSINKCVLICELNRINII